MGVGASDGDTEALTGEDIRSGFASADEGGAAGREGTVGSLGAAESEFEDRLRAGGAADAAGLGGDERLEIDEIEQG
jgi:hypothetical protein